MKAPWGLLSREMGLGPTRTKRYYSRWRKLNRQENTPYIERERARVRLYRKTHPEKWNEQTKRSRAKHRKAWLARKRRQYRETRRCFSCKTYRKGRPMHKVERLVEVNGKWVMQQVHWCGHC